VLSELQLISKLDILESQVQALVRGYKVLQNKVADRDNEVRILKEQIKVLQLELKQVQKNSLKVSGNFFNSQKIAKIVKNKLSEEELSELKEAIDAHIREIDKCIAQLSV
jgi:chromosome segregation ATPase